MSDKCGGVTRHGDQCEKPAIRGTDRCIQHTPGYKQQQAPRSSHFGTIAKLPSGRYRIIYWQDGRRHTESFPMGTPVKAVKSRLSSIETDIMRGSWASPKAGSISLREHAESWLASGVRRNRIRPTTEAKYRGLLDRNILPTLGDIALNDMRPAHVRVWFDELVADHRSTASNAYRLLATMFNSAVRDELIVKSPCTIEGASRDPASERPTATVAECQAALAAVPKEHRVAIMLTAWGQLRRSEVLGLQRRDVDLDAGTIKVERAWLITSGGQKLLGDPKTTAGRRTVHLPPDALDALRAHLDQFVGPADDAWLFKGSRGQPVHPRTLTRVWATARSTIGRDDLVLHDLRHSGLTWVAQAGATTAELMRRGGHSSPVAAARYQHAADLRDKSLAEALGRMSQKAEKVKKAADN